MKTTTQTRQAKFKAQKREDGFIQCAVWIPSDKKEQLLKYVAKLNKK